MTTLPGGEDPLHNARHWFRSSRNVYFTLLLIIVLASAVRLRLRNMPLERDEGEYAYSGQLMLQSIPPYKLAYNMKLPGTYAAYAAILAVFGETPSGVHLGLLFVNAATIVLVFLLGRRLSGPEAGIVAAASYAILSVSPSMLGFAGHATHFVVLAALAGILVLLKALENDNLWLLFLSGTLLGLAFLMKQPGIVFAVFAGFYLLAAPGNKAFSAPSLHRLGMLVCGFVIPFGLCCLWLLRSGVFHAFWFWTVLYASQYATTTPFGTGVALLRATLPSVIGPSFLIWIFAGIGLLCVIANHTDPSRQFALSFVLFSFLAVCPDFIFRQHYFILMLPAVSILAGLGTVSSSRFIAARCSHALLQYLPGVVACVMLGTSVYLQRAFFFEAAPSAVCREIYGGNPFPEAIPIADYIRNTTPQNARIAIFGSEPEIYFYANRHSATGYIYTYPLMEPQPYAGRMQQEMAAEIDKAQPEVVVFVNVGSSWLFQPKSDLSILQWAQRYIHSGYELTGVADIFRSRTEYRWGDTAKQYQPRSNSVVYVFRRKS